MSNKRTNVQKLVGAAVLAAIIVVLQLMVSSIRVGPFTITLALMPIIIGAVVYGPATGAALGFVFGAVVCYSVVTGTDAGGFLMFQQNAVVTLLVCLLKSTAAGWVAGRVSRFCGEKGKAQLGIALASVLCPIINTGILGIAMATVYRELVSGWAAAAGSTSVIGYIILGVVGLNFLIELAVNVVLIPTVFRIVSAVKKS